MWYFLLILLSIRASLDIFLSQLQFAVGGVDVSPGAMMNLLVLAILLVLLLNRGSKGILPCLIWAPYLLLSVISVLYTSDKLGAIKLYEAQLTYLAMFSFPFLFSSSVKSESLVNAILISCVFPFLYGLYELATGFSGDFRSQSTFPHANIFAFYILIVLAAAFYKLYNRQAHNALLASVMYIGVLFSATLFLLLTQTRSAWIAFGLMFGVFGLFIERRLLFVAALLPGLLLVPAVQTRLEDTSSSTNVAAGEALSSYAWRQVLWREALDDLDGSRMLGKGLGSFHINSSIFSTLVDDDGTTEAHSAYVQTIYENGWLGLAAYLLIYVACAIALWNGRRSDVRGAIIGLACVVAMLIVNYSDNTPYYLVYNWYAWSFLGFVISRNQAIWRQYQVSRPKRGAEARVSSIGQLSPGGSGA